MGLNNMARFNAALGAYSGKSGDSIRRDAKKYGIWGQTTSVQGWAKVADQMNGKTDEQAAERRRAAARMDAERDAERRVKREKRMSGLKEKFGHLFGKDTPSAEDQLGE